MKVSEKAQKLLSFIHPVVNEITKAADRELDFS